MKKRSQLKFASHYPRNRGQHNRQYTLMDELMASPKSPLPETQRLHQLAIMWHGLASLESAASPTTNDWRVCSDAVNLMETFVTNGICQDESGLLADAVEAMAIAGKRYAAGGALRLSGAGIGAVRSVLEDYATMLDLVPHRTVVQCHRLTEARIRAIQSGARQAHDVEVVAI